MRPTMMTRQMHAGGIALCLMAASCGGGEIDEGLRAAIVTACPGVEVHAGLADEMQSLMETGGPGRAAELPAGAVWCADNTGAPDTECIRYLGGAPGVGEPAPVDARAYTWATFGGGAMCQSGDDDPVEAIELAHGDDGDQAMVIWRRLR